MSYEVNSIEKVKCRTIQQYFRTVLQFGKFNSHHSDSSTSGCVPRRASPGVDVERHVVLVLAGVVAVPVQYLGRVRVPEQQLQYRNPARDAAGVNGRPSLHGEHLYQSRERLGTGNRGGLL